MAIAKQDDPQVDPQFDPLGAGWRIAWRGPMRDEPAGHSVRIRSTGEIIRARVVDVEIGHRTLTSLSDGVHHFRYLVRVLVEYDWQAERVRATPITWHHQFSSHKDAVRFCESELGWSALPTSTTKAEGDKSVTIGLGVLVGDDEAELAAERSRSASDELRSRGESGDVPNAYRNDRLGDHQAQTISWLLPQPSPAQCWPPYRVSTTLSPEVLAHHAVLAKQSTPLLFSIKLAILLLLLAYLYWMFG